MNSIKEEPFLEEENYNTRNSRLQEEFIFVSCDTEHEKSVKYEDDSENCLEVIS